MLACSVLEPCGPRGVGDDLSVFSGGVVTVVGVTLLATVVEVVGVVGVVGGDGVPLSPTVQCKHHCIFSQAILYPI